MGFLNKLTEWFSEENVARQQQRLQAWWETHRKQGWRHVLSTSWQMTKRVFWMIVLAILLIVVGISVIADFYWALIFAAVPVALIVLRRFKSAGVAMVLTGEVVGIGTAVVSQLGWKINVDDLEWAIVLTCVVAAVRINRRALSVVGGYGLAAFVVWLAVNLLAIVPNLFMDVPEQRIIHITWILLALVAIAVTFRAAGWPAGLMIAIAFVTAGYAQIFRGYAGTRGQDLDLWGWIVWYPDQFIYGILFVFAGAVLLLAPLRALRPPPKPGREFSDEAYAWMDALYERDKQVRVLKSREHAFLVKELQRLNTTAAALEEIGVTPEAFETYATERGIAEIRELGIVRKDGTVNPNKLAKHGFRPDFLVSYGIEPEELLTGEVIEQESEESDGSESLS